MELNTDFWRGRRVFVTGHTGFKGSWLLLMLRQLGADVYGYALEPPTEPSMFELLKLGGLGRHEIGDVRDLNALRASIERAAPEVVIHMAAQPLVRASYDQPVETYAVNVMGTVNLLDACRNVDGLGAIVVVTTDKCYENFGWERGYAEDDQLGGADPYSNSKAACELVVAGYRQSFFTNRSAGLASARAGNVIGGGDFASDRIVPDAMRAFMKGEPLMVRNPLAVRPWQHVLEPLAGYLLLAERLYGDHKLAEGWNFGPRPEESTPVRTIVDALVAEWGDGACWVQDEGEHPHEAATLKLDSGKAREQLGWRPRLELDQALRMTAAWFRAYQAGEDLISVSNRQIEEYLT